MTGRIIDASGYPRGRIDWRGPFRPQALIIAGVVGTTAYLALIPLAFLIRETFFGERGPTLEFFRSAYRASGLGTMVGNSLAFAAGSTLVAVGLGTALAYLTARTDIRFKRLIFVASLVPLIIPGVLHTVAWVFLASPRAGVINKALEPLIGPGTFNVFSMWGMIWVEGLHLSPLVFLLMHAAFRSMDPALEESALVSGGGLPTVVRRITIPLVRPALLSAALLMVVRSLGAFEVPALLGIPGGVWVFTSRIWRALSTYPTRFGEAGALAFSLLVVTSIGVFALSRLSKRVRSFATVTGRGFRPRPVALGRWRRAANAFVLVYFALAVLAPLLILVYASTQNFYTVPSVESLSHATLDNFRYTLSHPGTLRALRNSVVLGTVAATAVMCFMAVASWVVVRTRVRGRWVIDNLASLPLAIPGLVMGVALLFVYLRVPVPVYGTLWILLLAYFTRYMPYGMRYASASMYQIGAELEESARTSGATWWQAFRRVDLPLLMPGLVAGWIYVLTISFRELSSSILLYTPGNEVLAVRIWEQWQNGQLTELASLGVVMVSILVVLAALAHRLGARVGVVER